MGLELRCTGKFREFEGEGRLMLETDALQFRGAFRFDALLRGLEVEARGGELRVRGAGAEARFVLGEAAAKWAERIQHPKGLIDKLGIKADQEVALVGMEDEEFRASLKDRACTVVAGAPRKPCDVLFMGISARKALARIPELLPRLAPSGALWVVYPKARQEVGESDVRSAGRGSGLKDVKVVRFSETHTALKFMRPKSATGRSTRA